MNSTRTTRSRIGVSRGFTLAELMLALVVAVLVGWLLVGLASSVRRYQGLRRTRGTIATVMRAMAAYGRAEGQWPRGAGDASSTTRLLRHLTNSPASAELLAGLGPEVISTGPDGDVLFDGFGRRMLYHHRDDGGDRPLLQSVGMDPADRSDDMSIPLPWDE